MVKSSLIELISTFSPKEFRDFEEYVNSSFFNKNEAVLKLFEYVKKHYPGFESMKFSKEIVYKEIFPNVEYNDGFMRTVMFNLTRLAEDYIAYCNYKSRGIYENLHLINELNARNLDKQASKNIKSAQETVNRYENDDETYFLDMFQLEKEKNVLYDRNKKILNVKDIPVDELTHESEYLIRYSFIHILKRYRYLLNKKTIMNVDFELEFEDEITSFLLKNIEKYSSIPSLEGLVRQIQLIRTNDRQYYYRLKELYMDINNSISIGERHNGLSLISGYCIGEHYKGRSELMKEYIEIQKFRDKYDFVKMYKNDYVTTLYFRSVVTACVMQNELEWCEYFIDKYKKALPPESSENAYNFALARIREKQKRYGESLELLKNVKLEDVFYKVNIKSLMSKLFYSLGMMNELSDLLDTYRKFLKNDKIITEGFRIVNTNYVKLMTDLIKLKENSGRVSIAEYKKKLVTTDSMSKDWIYEKLEEIESEREKRS